MDTEDGRLFIKNLAYYVRTHERALANAIQLQKQPPRHAHSQSVGGAGSSRPGTNSSTSSLSSQPGTAQPPSAFASALSSFGFTSQGLKPAKLYLTPNQLYFLLSRFEELGVTVGPMNVRLESIHADSTSMNYVSFLTQTKRPKGRSSDQDSLHSVSSVRSVMSSMSSMLSSFSLSSNSSAKIEKRRAAELEDIRYLYSAFTKIPCLKLVLDHRIRRIAGYEEFPFDTAVPIYVFKNVTVLEVVDQDFRSFFGWDRLAEQLRSLTVKRAELDDPTDLLTNIVLDDMDKRRKRSSKNQSSPSMALATPSPAFRFAEPARPSSSLESPMAIPHPESADGSRGSDISTPTTSYSKQGYFSRLQSTSPPRPSSARRGSMHLQGKRQRRASSSSTSSVPGNTPRTSSTNLLSSYSGLPALKWRFLRHLSLADNGLTSVSVQSLFPLVSTLHSLDLSSNLFSEIPESLASLMSLRALNLSNCLIESLHPLARNPLPAITVLNLRGNRLGSLAGVEKLLSLERLDLRDNKLKDPTETARLTGMPDFRDLYIFRNPFTKTHGNHRVTIFNLFRQTPGYTDDITIDSTSPSYSERRQLVDRVPESASVPVVRPPLDDDEEDRLDNEVAAADPPTNLPVETREIATSATTEPPDDALEAPQTPTADETAGTRSQRRRKTPRRRVVDITQDPSSSPRSPGTASDVGSPDATFVTAVQTPGTARTRGPAQSRRQSQGRAGGDDYYYSSSPSQRGLGGRRSSEINETRSFTRAGAVNVAPSLADSPGQQPDGGLGIVTGGGGGSGGLTMTNEQYRQKIEALKREYGNGWLSALGDDAKAAAAAAKATTAKT